ncbi:serine/threonine protein kinase [Candidatus Obscuribacterales bacterium]|nr:serine/threonine protein kinase [Candidatus Obscuribacterales bacterium]
MTQDQSFDKTTPMPAGGGTSGAYVTHIGTTIGRYQIQKLVGTGGMGALFAAEHVEIGRKVAIQVLHPDFRVSEDIFARFKQEATLAASLSHTNVCPVFDFGRLEDGTPYLIMDLLEGLTLADLIAREGMLEPRRAVRIFAQICDALSHAHKKGVAHRDLKPSNIMIENDDGIELAKIVDFGIAKSLEKNAPQLTAAHETIGSPYYMSPEQCQAGPIDHRTDIYSLGCLMYETLTGRTPFRAQNALQMMYAHVHNEPEPMNEIAPSAGIPPALEQVVLKAMRKNPDERWQTAEELKVAAFTSVGAKTLDCLVDAAAYRTQSGKPIAKIDSSSSTPSKSKKPLILAGISVLLLGVVGAVGMSNSESIQLLMDGRQPGYIYNGDDNAPTTWVNKNYISNPAVQAVYLGQAHDTPRSEDNNPNIMGHVTVKLTPKFPNSILVLSSHAQVEWNIVKAPGTKINKVYVDQTYGKSRVKGVPPEDVVQLTHVPMSLLSADDPTSDSGFVAWNEEVKKATDGKQIHTLQVAQQLKAFEL